MLHNIFFTCPHAIPAWILPRWISTPRESLGQHWNLNVKRPSSLTTHLDNSGMRSLSARPRKPFNISFQSLNGCLNTILRCLDSTFLLVSPLPALPFLKESAMPNSLKFLQSLAYVSNLTVLLRFCFRPSAGVIFFFFFCIKNEVNLLISFMILVADSSFVPALVYAILGSSKHVAVGTVAACSLLIADTIGSKVSSKDDPTLYLHLVFTAAFITGVFQAALGFLRRV